MEIFLNTYLALIIIIFLYMNFWFALALILKRNDIADIAWGLGFLICVFYSYLFISNEILGQSFLIFFLIVLWAVRLAIHIFMRNKNKKEDSRYQKWRQDWGKNFLLRTYFQVFILQGFFLLIIVLPAIVGIIFGQEINIITIIGLIIWLFGFIFESVGDYQLSVFIKKPENKGKILQSGLWKYTRHPNYFGEVTMWWGIWTMTFNTNFWLISVLGPILITFLILKVSGIPLLEERKKGDPAFEEYKKRTSMFFPWFSKKIAEK